MTAADDLLVAGQTASDRAFAVHGQGDHEAAVALYDQAIALRPGYARNHANRAACLQAMKRHVEAVAGYDRALALNPHYAHAHHNRGMSLMSLGEPEAAIAGIDRAVELLPGEPSFHVSRGDVLKSLARFDAVLASYDRALAIAPGFDKAEVARAALLLLTGRVREGLEQMDSVRFKPSVAPPHKHLSRFLALPPEQRMGKVVLLHGERGLGDTVQFCRYVGIIAAMGARVLFSPQTPLRPLMRRLQPAVELVGRKVSEFETDFDFEAPLMSMPAIMKTTLETIPAAIPYLSAEPERVAHWARVIGAEGFKIGVCWQGGVHGGDDAGRSFRAALLAPLAAAPGVRLISLHKGDGEAQLQHLPPGMMIETLGPDFDAGEGAFLDTAAVIAHCDLVVTSDTSVAHLAGALGGPVWVGLQQVPEWRWILNRADSPWYPNMRLFRQSQRRDWPGVIGAMRAELDGLLPT